VSENVNCRKQAVTLTENRPTTRPGQKVLRRFYANQPEYSRRLDNKLR
jgi:hypothetical protein